MKDPLEYTQEELTKLPTQELQVLLEESNKKAKIFSVKQRVEKALINGLYGTLGNKWFSLFNEEMACAITGNGRYFIRKLAMYVEEELQRFIPQDTPYVFAGDTDSIYFHIAPFINRLPEGMGLQEKSDVADEFEKTIIMPVVQRCIHDFATELNAYNEDIIGVEREIIADKGVYVAKKKYFARVIDNEGKRYTTPEVKVMGLEVIKGGTPAFTKRTLVSKSDYDSIDIMLDGTKSDMLEWIEEKRTEYIQAPIPDTNITAGVSNLEYSLGDKGIPIGARSALVHNKYIEENNLTDMFEAIHPGDKPKRCFLIEPNPLNSNVVSYIDPRFIQMFEDYIDHDTNFEKGFFNPLQIMVQPLNWDLKKTSDALDEW